MRSHTITVQENKRNRGTLCGYKAFSYCVWKFLMERRAAIYLTFAQELLRVQSK